MWTRLLASLFGPAALAGPLAVPDDVRPELASAAPPADWTVPEGVSFDVTEATVVDGQVVVTGHLTNEASAPRTVFLFPYRLSDPGGGAPPIFSALQLTTRPGPLSVKPMPSMAPALDVTDLPTAGAPSDPLPPRPAQAVPPPPPAPPPPVRLELPARSIVALTGRLSLAHDTWTAGDTLSIDWVFGFWPSDGRPTGQVDVVLP